MKLPNRAILIALAVALVLGALLSPLASSLPDGLEWALGRLGVESADDAPGGSLAAPMAEYAVPGVRSAYLGKALAGLVGVLVVFGVGYGVACALRRKTRASGAEQ